MWILTSYALAGLAMRPVSGHLAGTVGYRAVLRAAMMATMIGVLALALSIAIGIAYAGTVNIMLNGLGVLLSPRENAGVLPGLNSGAFNLGAGLSFAALYAVGTGLAPAGPAFTAGMLAGAVVLVLAPTASLLVRRPAGAEVHAVVSPSSTPGTDRA